MAPGELEVYELAYRLGRFAHEVWNLDYDEYCGWLEYFRLRPVGWREDYRAFTFLQTQGVKAKPQDIFSSLIPLYHAPGQSEIPGMLQGTNFKQSAIFTRLLSAVGGDDPTKVLI